MQNEPLPALCAIYTNITLLWMFGLFLSLFASSVSYMIYFERKEDFSFEENQIMVNTSRALFSD
jgi:hypothetical protein